MAGRALDQKASPCFDVPSPRGRPVRRPPRSCARRLRDECVQRRRRHGSSSERVRRLATGELSEVSFSGDVGDSLTATWHSTVETPKSTTVTTLVEGDGEAVADGDTVSTYLWVGNGTTKKDVYSDYDTGAPEAIPNNDQVGAVFSELLRARRTALASLR